MAGNPPEHDRAVLITDATTLRDCAGRLEELTARLPAGDAAHEWAAALEALARRCRVAAGDLEAAAGTGQGPNQSNSA
jgi:hypothetical protein